jgi:hypothetical protein
MNHFRTLCSRIYQFTGFGREAARRNIPFLVLQGLCS